MKNSTQSFSIKQIKGPGLNSPLAGQTVKTRGLVIGVLRRGFFLQTPDVKWDGVISDGIFVYSTEWQATLGSMLEVVGEVTDYVKHETAKPVTQLRLQDMQTLSNRDPNNQPYQVHAVALSAAILPHGNAELAKLLNSLGGMLVSISAGQTFIAPSNLYGDYVLALDAEGTDTSVVRTEHSGVVASAENPDRWFPGFRVTNYNHAQRLNVGAKLLSDISGPLNYRADSYQISVSEPFKVEASFVNISKSSLQPKDGSVTIMTLNCFNLDPHVESEDLVLNPRRDVDDDWGEGRFHTLAQAVVLQANSPDIVALQEIQDSDGAEMTDVVDASATYQLLIKTIEQLSGIKYRWIDVNPKMGEDGGQPGGNIRNGFLYNPQRVALVEGSARVFGANEAYFEDSRKPLLALFKEQASGKVIACINLHLASKRHQASIFAPIDPGVDAKLSVRVAQATRIAEEAARLNEQGINYYVTGDFNDTEYSETLQALLADHSVNLVDLLAPDQRYDYNHRGKLQVLMHGIVSKRSPIEYAEYEIIHGNELIGVQPGEESDKPSDHAYVIARLQLS